MTRRSFPQTSAGLGVLAALVLALSPAAAPARQPASGAASASGAAPGTAVPPEISFAPRWTLGETRVYEEIKTRRKIPKGGLPNQVAGRTRVVVKVVEAGAGGYLLSWNVAETVVEGGGALNQNPDVADLRKSMTDWVVLLDLDRSGNLRGVKNWKEIQRKAQAAHVSIQKSRDFLQMPLEAQARYRARLESTVATREQVEAVCTREAQAFLAPIGLVFQSGKPIDYQARLAHPRGGAPLATHARFQVTTIDPASGRAIVEWRQSVDPRQSEGNGLGGAISRLGRNFGLPPSPGGADSNQKHDPSITDECRYLMDTRTGWVLDMDQTRRIVEPDGSIFEESLRIRRSNPAAAVRPNPAAAVRPDPRSRTR